jgi:alanyl-tRNA synthetase
MTTDELRKLFLDFFIEKDHSLVPSDSLLPTYDPSLLFSGAGMNQFKDEFLGRGKRTFKRACSSQKCIRTGDIDSVGVTTSHHVFFEMLGNFSFGDYFKQDAIRWAWEFYLDVLKIPYEKLSVSVYEQDEEAYSIWEKEIGLPESKIHRFNAHENFWPADAPTEAPAGQLCGPCSEIFYDLGPNDCADPDCSPACDCRRHVEIWNLVFQQYEKGGKPGELHDLPQKNIDTGAGLERNAAVMQGVRSDFDLDIFRPLVDEAERLIGAKVDRGDEENMKYLRRVADYMRAVAFLISDGVLPGNDGRGYVERRLLRRAVLAGRALGADGPFCYNMVAPVADVMGGQYPDLRERRENIARIVKAEEDKFARTLGSGVAKMRGHAPGRGLLAGPRGLRRGGREAARARPGGQRLQRGRLRRRDRPGQGEGRGQRVRARVVGEGPGRGPRDRQGRRARRGGRGRRGRPAGAGPDSVLRRGRRPGGRHRCHPGRGPRVGLRREGRHQGRRDRPAPRQH